MKFRILIEEEEGTYVVQCPSLPGCVSQGKSRAEAVENIKEAIMGYVASLRKHNEHIPPPLEEDVVEVRV